MRSSLICFSDAHFWHEADTHLLIAQWKLLAGKSHSHALVISIGRHGRNGSVRLINFTGVHTLPSNDLDSAAKQLAISAT